MTRYERIIANDKVLPHDVRSLLAGASRAVRLSNDISDDGSASNAVQMVAAGIVSPLALLYTWWVLQDAVDKGVKRLYFLARDGQILLKVAKVLVDSWNLDIDLRYLYVSRESLMLPSFQKVTEFERYWVPWGYLSSITLGEIAKRLNLSASDLSSHFSVNSLVTDFSAPLGERDIAIVMETLDRDDVRSLIQERNQKLCADTYGYLDQEGLCEQTPYALVDTGWKGTSQYALSSILNRFGVKQAKTLTGYYLGLNDEIFVHEQNCLKPFLFDWSRSSRDYRLYNFLCFEMLFAAKHARTTSYVEEQGVYRPLFKGESPAACHWILDAHHEFVQAYAGYVARLLNFDDFPSEADSLCRRLMKAFISSPGEDEASVYGDYPIASEMREGDMQKMAPEMKLGDFMKIALGNEKVRGYWPQASFVRSGLNLVNFGYGVFLDMRLLDIYRKYFLKY